MSRAFRLNAQSLFLTYPNCGLKQECFSFLSRKFAGNLRYLVVAQETHESGEPHLHCLAVLHRRVNWRDPRCLDFNGHHGDYTTARDVEASDRYCRKDDADPLVEGELPITAERGLRGRHERNQLWADALEQPNYDSFMAAIRTADPREFVINYDRISSFGRQMFRTPAVEYTDPFGDSWMSNTQMDSWALDNITNWTPTQAVRPKSLILIGICV